MDMPGMDMASTADHGGAGWPSQRHDGMEVCPFAAAASVMAVGHAQPLAVFTAFLSTLIVFPPAKTVPRGTIVPTSLPRGPPITV
jgi:hypothetical protein